MKKYYEENIKFDTAKFTSGFYAVVLLIGGEFGLWLNSDIKDTKTTLSLFIGIVIILGGLVYLFYLNGRIKSDILKLKDYEFD